MSHVAFSFQNAVKSIIYCILPFGIYYNMYEAEVFHLREPKMVMEEEDLVDKAIRTSTKYKNKWAITIFNKQFLRNWVKASSACTGFWRHV